MAPHRLEADRHMPAAAVRWTRLITEQRKPRGAPRDLQGAGRLQQGAGAAPTLAAALRRSGWSKSKPPTCGPDILGTEYSAHFGSSWPCARLVVVAFLLYLNTRSVTETVIVLLAVPFSLVGAVWLLYALSYKLSVAVWVGMIALAGLDAETGVVMLLYLQLAYRRRQAAGQMTTPGDLEDAIVEGAAQRIRPKLMTVMVLLIGLLPIMWSNGTGADVMRRIAAPMVGGIVTSFLLELTVYPAIYATWKRRVLQTLVDRAEVQ
jgi:hypothetical protein